MDSEKLRQDMISLYEKTFHYKFNREHYDKNMDKLRKQDEALLARIEKACEESDGSVDEVASYIPQYVSGLLKNVSSKRKRDMTALDHKMNMVSYYVPLMGEIPGEAAKSLGEKMVEQWNALMPEYKIGYTTVGDIRGGFKTTPCYITTAVCEGLGRPDNCYELNILRSYRDRYLMGTEAGARLVEEYYNISPTIVKKISKRADSHKIYQDIWENYLNPCVRLIEEDKPAECKELYRTMVRTLEKQYLYAGGNYE